MRVRRIRLDLGYRGTRFHGFAANPDVPTIGGALKAALEKVLRHEVVLMVAGRTDRGVHAMGQVVSFETDAAHFEALSLRAALNKLCAPDIVVTAVSEVGSDFHARFSATSRLYRYQMMDSELADPLRAETVWWIGPPLDLNLLRTCASQVVGLHDFTGFCRKPKNQPDATSVRRVKAAGCERVGDELHFVIEANAFCHQMVRSIVGACADVARGRSDPDLVAELLATGDRALAPELAPPHGLMLERVIY